MAKGGPVQEGGGEDRGGEHKTYRMVFPAKAGPRHCPFEGFSGLAATRTDMWVHFYHRHIHNTVVIMEYVNLPTHGIPCKIFW